MATIYENRVATNSKQSHDPNEVEIRTPRQMRAILFRERSLADRSQKPFAFIALDVSGMESSRGARQKIEQAIVRQVRCVDQCGWLNQRQIGVVLPNCSATAAIAKADQIQQSLTFGSAAPRRSVYRYPTAWRMGDEIARHASGEEQTLPMESLWVQPISNIKRALDIVGASVGAILLLPLFALVALAIKFTSPGPVLFTQPRTGHGGKRFLMLKFRSMTFDAEERKTELLSLNEQDGPAFKIQNDPRITPLGHFLRKTSIDELPQLWNVLRGEMSLVGPRPLPCEEMDACSGWLRRRLEVTPGLTCIWQIEGRNQVSFNEWVRMDMRYLRRHSLLVDLKILLATVPAVLFCRGAR